MKWATRTYVRTYVHALNAGYVAEPFEVRQVGQFLQDMESRMAQMRRAAGEEKVGS